MASAIKKRHVSGLFLSLRGPAYDDGFGEKYIVEFDGDWGRSIGLKNERCVSIKQGLTCGDYIRIDIEELPNLISDLQEIEKRVKECDMSIVDEVKDNGGRL